MAHYKKRYTETKIKITFKKEMREQKQRRREKKRNGAERRTTTNQKKRIRETENKKKRIERFHTVISVRRENNLIQKKSEKMGEQH